MCVFFAEKDLNAETSRMSHPQSSTDWQLRGLYEVESCTIRVILRSQVSHFLSTPLFVFSPI